MKSRLLAILSALIGLTLFVYVIRQTGVNEIWANVRQLGVGFLLILVISSARYLSRSLAWLLCMTPEQRQIGFWTLWRARLAGEAVGDLTFGPMVAEPLRLIALGNRLSLTSGLSSLAVENISYTLSSGLMVMGGAVALLASFALEESLRVAMFVALAVVAIITIATFLAIAKRWKLGSGIAWWLAQFLVRDKTKLAWIESKIAYQREIEEYVFDFYATRPKDFCLLLLCHATFHFAGMLEIYATLRLLGIELTLATAFMLEAVNRAINIAFIFVPALVGVDEALTRLLTETLRLGGTAGVTLAIVRKIRMFFWIAIGLLFLLNNRSNQTQK